MVALTNIPFPFSILPLMEQELHLLLGHISSAILLICRLFCRLLLTFFTCFTYDSATIGIGADSPFRAPQFISDRHLTSIESSSVNNLLILHEIVPLVEQELFFLLGHLSSYIIITCSPLCHLLIIYLFRIIYNHQLSRNCCPAREPGFTYSHHLVFVELCRRLLIFLFVFNIIYVACGERAASLSRASQSIYVEHLAFIESLFVSDLLILLEIHVVQFVE